MALHHHHHHQQQSIRSTSDDGDSGSEDEESTPLHRMAMYPVPHSHWFPRSLSFKPWNRVRAVKQQQQQPSGGVLPRRLRIQVSRPLQVRVTKDIVETYQLCNPSFQHSENLNPKRYLTNPSIPKFNGGCDNENHDLILYYGCVFVNENATQRYVVKELVGQGTFGQVARCYTIETNTNVAVKIIKNQLAYYTQAKVEIGILHVV
jgi:dual specificity protein kinase YAK1